MENIFFYFEIIINDSVSFFFSILLPMFSRADKLIYGKYCAFDDKSMEFCVLYLDIIGFNFRHLSRSTEGHGFQYTRFLRIEACIDILIDN